MWDTFVERASLLDDLTRRKIFQRHRRGETAESLARRYGQSKTVIQRVLDERQAARIGDLPLRYVPNVQFATILAGDCGEAEILGPAPGTEAPSHPSPPATSFGAPLLNPAQEVHLFRKMNYLKYKASQLRQRLDPRRPARRLMARIERLYDEAVAVKNQIISANLRLVVSIAKHYCDGSEDFCELVSDGNVSLIRAVENFDYARGNRFSTYASLTIMRNYSRTIREGHRRRERFRTGLDETVNGVADPQGDPHASAFHRREQEAEIARLLTRLDARERKIVVRRFGLEQGGSPKTLEQIGAELGVTKERIRQIEVRALRKLQEAAQKSGRQLLDVN